MGFENDLRGWLAKALLQGVPDGVVGFSFNLFEHLEPKSRFGVELVGAGSFDPSNSDWACDEVWEPSVGRSISISTEFSGETWDECLSKMGSLIMTILAEATDVAARLRSAAGVGLGFVDGELQLLWNDGQAAPAR